MTTLKKIQLLAVSAGLLISMSSCLKSKEPDFGLAGLNYYVQQKIQGTDTTFAPYFIFQANEVIAEAKVTSTYEPLGYSLTKFNDYTREISDSYRLYTSQIPNGQYIIAMGSVDAKTAQNTFTIKVDKTLGNWNEVDITYDPAKGITAKWDAVKNANVYGLYARSASDIKSQKYLMKSVENKTELFFTKDEAAYLRQSNGEAFFEDGKGYVFELVAHYVDSYGGLQVKLVNTGNEAQLTVPAWGK